MLNTQIYPKSSDVQGNLGTQARVQLQPYTLHCSIRSHFNAKIQSLFLPKLQKRISMIRSRT